MGSKMVFWGIFSYPGGSSSFRYLRRSHTVARSAAARLRGIHVLCVVYSCRSVHVLPLSYIQSRESSRGSSWSCVHDEPVHSDYNLAGWTGPTPDCVCQCPPRVGIIPRICRKWGFEKIDGSDAIMARNWRSFLIRQSGLFGNLFNSLCRTVRLWSGQGSDSQEPEWGPNGSHSLDRSRDCVHAGEFLLALACLELNRCSTCLPWPGPASFRVCAFQL